MLEVGIQSQHRSILVSDCIIVANLEGRPLASILSECQMSEADLSEHILGSVSGTVVDDQEVLITDELSDTIG